MNKFRKNLIYKCVECAITQNCRICKFHDSCCGIEEVVTDCLYEMHPVEQIEIIAHCIEILKRED